MTAVSGTSGSGLPEGGDVGQVVTNTAPGTGEWDDLPAAPAVPTTEDIQDIVGAMFGGPLNFGLIHLYNDGANEFDISLRKRHVVSTFFEAADISSRFNPQAGSGTILVTPEGVTLETSLDQFDSTSLQVSQDGVIHPSHNPEIVFQARFDSSPSDVDGVYYFVGLAANGGTTGSPESASVGFEFQPNEDNDIDVYVVWNDATSHRTLVNTVFVNDWNSYRITFDKASNGTIWLRFAINGVIEAGQGVNVNNFGTESLYIEAYVLGDSATNSPKITVQSLSVAVDA